MNFIVKQIGFNSKEYFQALGLRYEVLRRPLELHFNVNDLHSENSEIHVAAFLENRVVGCLIISKKTDNSKLLKMRQVAVNHLFQGIGIGKKLVQFSENWAIQNQYSSFELHARATAVPFYLSLGYEVQGDEFLEVNIPHYKMVKKLTV